MVVRILGGYRVRFCLIFVFECDWLRCSGRSCFGVCLGGISYVEVGRGLRSGEYG